jgi:glycerate 2-kinase
VSVENPRFKEHACHVRELLRAAIAAADPARCVEQAVRTHPPRSARPAVVAIGKAAPAMRRGYAQALGEPRAEFMVTIEGIGAPPWAKVGDHPLPTDRNGEHARALAKFLRDPAHDGFVVLLSGGGSALLSLPAEGVSLGDLRTATDSLLRAGADIHELNTVRKHLEALKGGRAARLTHPRPVDVYVMSDVIGNDMSVIASGPWWPDQSTFGDALWILGRRGVRAPPAIVKRLRAGAAGNVDETPKRGDPCFERVRAVIAGDNGMAVEGVRRRAEEFGFHVGRAPALAGEARLEAGAFLRLASLKAPGCAVAGGETTVDVRGASGRGGRNQEFALAAALEIEGRAGAVVAAFATDGVDGPTDAAGALVTGSTCARARELGIDPAASLGNHDSWTFFDRVGGHLRTGPTGTNVNDVALILMYASAKP